jgi:hypothetical protein
MTDGHSISLSWNKAPIWSLRPDLCYCMIMAGLLMWGAFSDERMGLPFTIAAGSRQISHFRVRVRGTHDHILLSQIRDSPNLEGHVPIFISPRNRVDQLYSPGTGFPFRRLLRLAGLRWSYSNPPPHGSHWLFTTELFFITTSHGTNIIHNFQQYTYYCVFTDPLLINGFFCCLCVLISAGNCLPNRCLAMKYFGFLACCHNIEDIR